MELKELVERQRAPLLKTLGESIRIPSVREEDESGYPYGANIQRTLEFMLETGKSLGLRVGSMDNQVGWCEFGEGEEMVAVLGHLDVVPAGEGWSGDPFSGEVRDGKVFGRGSMDDKGPTVAALYALGALKESGLPLRRRVRLLMGTNEETGSADMKYYLAHGGERPVMGFTPDGEYPVINGEKGIVNVTFRRGLRQSGPVRLIKLAGGDAPNVVPSSASAELECADELAKQIAAALPEKVECIPIPGGIRMVAQGVSAHGSTPEQGENAIGRLLLELNALPLEGELVGAVRFLAEKIGMETDGSSLGLALEDDMSGALTFNLGVIAGEETGLTCRVNYRYPVTKSLKDCGPKFQAELEAAGFEVVEQTHKESLYVPPESELVTTLMRVYQEETGLSDPPKSIGGGTYAKAMPNVVAFGPVFPGDEVREHKPDEFIEVDRLMQNAQIIARAMYELAK
ncbi:dipeptidase PepV [Oscillibacter sp.]|uniref:dipeptidase PepV n=1 Tax=Oscillibacter sp. TaxID=1945593 RepID=UPI00289BAC14|nr:dipeptidase PepV [Oscillibacter sp.]